MAPGIFQAATLALRAAGSICPSAPTCPQDDQCSMTANGITLQVSCSTDYYGGDLQRAQTSSLANCMRACANTPACVAASYVSGNCYIKNTLNPASANTNVIGIAVTSRETSTPPASDGKTCPASFTCPENNGCTYTDGLRTFALSCSEDFYGGDYASQYSESLQACTQACAGEPQCVAASFVGGNSGGACYKKSSKNGGTFNDNVDAVYAVTASIQSSSISSTSTSSATQSSIATSSSVVDSSTSTTVSSSSSSSSTSSSTPVITLTSPSSSASSIATSASSASSDTSTAASSSTSVSSNSSTTSSAAPTPTCDATSIGPNLIQNPSFEQVSGSGSGSTVTSWTLSSRSVYPVTFQSAAHSGRTYLVLLVSSTVRTGSASQKINALLDTSQTYTAKFYFNPYTGTAGNGCTVEAYANNVRVFSRALTSFTNAISWELATTDVFKPASSDVTFKLQYSCSSGTSSSSLLIDDVSLTTVCAANS